MPLTTPTTTSCISVMYQSVCPAARLCVCVCLCVYVVAVNKCVSHVSPPLSVCAYMCANTCLRVLSQYTFCRASHILSCLALTSESQILPRFTHPFCLGIHKYILSLGYHTVHSAWLHTYILPWLSHIHVFLVASHIHSKPWLHTYILP